MKNILITLLLILTFNCAAQIEKYDIVHSVYKVKKDGEWKYESMEADKLFRFVVDQDEKKIYLNWMIFDIFTILDSNQPYKEAERSIYEFLCNDIDGNQCVLILEKLDDKLISATITYNNFHVIFSLENSKL